MTTEVKRTSSGLNMPARKTGDGPIGVRRLSDESFAIDVMTAGVEQGIQITDYNAWRLFGMLALMLDLPLSPKVGKAIKLTKDVEVTIAPTKPLKTLGDRVAWNLRKKAHLEFLAANKVCPVCGGGEDYGACSRCKRTGWVPKTKRERERQRT